MTACPECGFDIAGEGACPVCDRNASKPRVGLRAVGPVASALRFALSAASSLAAIALALTLYFSLAPSGVSDSDLRATALGPGAEASRSPGPTLGASKNQAFEVYAKRLARHDPGSVEDRAVVLLLASKHRPPTDSRESYLAWMLANTKENAEQLGKKWERSRELLRRGEVKNQAVLEAFLYTPREFFARSYNAKKAYDDTAIPIGHGQTISGPHMVSHMTDTIAPLRSDRILEIGTGSGYQSALLSELSDEVYTIEIVAGLAAETDAIYKKLEKSYPEYLGVERKNADGYYGWPEHAPFHKIIVTAGIDHIPPPLLAQLAPDGVMVIPVGPPTGQTVLKVVKKSLPGGGFSFERSDIYHGRKVIFVPFTAQSGKAHSLDDAQGLDDGKGK